MLGSHTCRHVADVPLRVQGGQAGLNRHQRTRRLIHQGLHEPAQVNIT